GSVYVSVSGGSNNGNLWLSSDNVSLNSGQTTTLTIYTSGGYYGTSFYVSSNSNSGTVSASVSGNSLTLNALSNGSSTVTVCGYSYSGCDSVYVTVSGSSNPGSVWVSPSSINLNVGQTSGVSIYSDTGSNSGYYVSSNSNTNAVTSTISGNNLNLTGNNNGYATVLVCAYSSNYACASVYVTVNGSTWNQISFLSQSLPQPTINQYYSAQLSVSGGSWPYYFSLISGSLPNGLTLSSSGLISGTPTTSGYYNFQVRASDSQNRTGSQNLSVTVGNIWGGQTYKNGTLISENGTIYIVYKNLKSGFANMWSFSGLGYRAENILNTGFTNLANSGYVINTMQIAHPWGSWIKSGSTVYFVHQDGLIPIPSFDVFLNNGGEDRLVVPANSYDFSNKPVLGLMTSNDWRLR
ncbi:MAG: putative Ig domain-containing protein, partial [Acidobacteriaceae bacterium]